jgi:hypothetical protein
MGARVFVFKVTLSSFQDQRRQIFLSILVLHAVRGLRSSSDFTYTAALDRSS